MSGFEKMTLISLDELDRLKQKQLSSYNPELRTMVALKDEMDQILGRSDLDAEQKLMLFQSVQHRFDKIRKQREMRIAPVESEDRNPIAAPVVAQPALTSRIAVATTSSSHAPPQINIIETVPKNQQEKAAVLAKILEQQGNKIAWNNKRELVIDGEPMPNTNINDLTRHLYVQGSKNIPHGLNTFISALNSYNIPQSSISNRSVIQTLNSSRAPSLASASQAIDSHVPQMSDYLSASDDRIAFSRSNSPTLTSSSTTQKGNGCPPGKRPRILSMYKI